MKQEFKLKNIVWIIPSIWWWVWLWIASYLMNWVVDYKLVIMVIILTFVMFNYIILEKILLKNMSFVLFTLIFYFIYNLSWDFSVEKNKDVYLIIWWLLAFWYWYKKYERDKELELIEKYKAKLIKSRRLYVLIKKEKNTDIIIDWYKEILHIWHEIFYLWEKSYISKELFSELDNMIKNALFDILDEDKINYYKREKKYINDDCISIMDNSYFLLSLKDFMNFKDLDPNWFYKYLKNKINIWLRQNTKSKDSEMENFIKLFKELNTILF